MSFRNRVACRLDAHNTIGLDMDGCLVPGTRFACAKTSALLRQYIRDTYQVKTFYVVTFRAPIWAEQVIYELVEHGIPSKMIRGVIACPLEYWQAHQYSKFLPERTLTPTLRAGVRHYLEWKGKACRELGCTALVDDRPDEVIKGCVKYAVEFIDIRDFRYKPQSVTVPVNSSPKRHLLAD